MPAPMRAPMTNPARRRTLRLEVRLVLAPVRVATTACC